MKSAWFDPLLYSYSSFLLTIAFSRLANQNLAIEQAIRTVAETEEVGNEIIGELKSNREKIESSSEKAKEVNGMTDAASRLIRRMTKREWTLGFF